MSSTSDTIFALSSGRPRTAIAVVRISGPQAGRALASLRIEPPPARRATLATLKTTDGEPIDDALVLWFPAPHSATGEDIAELHVHGSQAVLTALFDLLSRVDGLRPADAGEFTKRAFENGKLDLTEVEGLADLIDAETEMQRRQALRQLKGLLGDRAERWREEIIAASALIEAGIDFSDEGDVPDEVMTPALEAIALLRDDIAKTLGVPAQSERLREGLVVAIAGPPNAGKSTLLNRLARRDAAIVSPYAGTTRDAIEVHLDLGGYPVALIDTAGIRETNDPIEQEGVRRARARAGDADLVLWVTDATVGASSVAEDLGGERWIVRNKIDLVPGDALRIDSAHSRVSGNPETIEANSDRLAKTGSPLSRGRAAEEKLGSNPGHHIPAEEFQISAERGDGVEKLVAALTAFAGRYFGGTESALITRARHRSLLEQARDSLERTLNSRSLGEEIVAEELRTAVHSLGRLTGRVDIEDILDKIFRYFCIGK